MPRIALTAHEGTAVNRVKKKECSELNNWGVREPRAQVGVSPLAVSLVAVSPVAASLLTVSVVGLRDREVAEDSKLNLLEKTISIVIGKAKH